MKIFDVQSVEIHAPYDLVFNYVADPANLPEWTHAFASVDGRWATMRTPAGSTDVELSTTVERNAGTIDWSMTFPTGEKARAWSRVVPHRAGRVIYSFVLMAPPVPLEKVEGTLAEQSKALAAELALLQRIVEARAKSADAAVPVR